MRACRIGSSEQGTTLEITRLSGDTRQLWFPVRTLRPTVICFSFELPSVCAPRHDTFLFRRAALSARLLPYRHVYQLSQPHGPSKSSFLEFDLRHHNAIFNHLNLFILELTQLQGFRPPQILQPEEVKGPPQPGQGCTGDRG